MMGRQGFRFAHVPRTGGQSINRAWRLRPPEYHGHMLPLDAYANGDFVYGFARNPWDRVVSVFLGCIDTSVWEFRNWVLEGMRSPAYRGIPIWAPCATWLRGANFVGRFEHRQRDLEILAGILGRDVPTEHQGKTDRKPYQEYYDSETRAVVATLLKEDIETYGYFFDEEAAWVG